MTRVLIGDVPRLVSDILSLAISTQSDMEIIREAGSRFATPPKTNAPDVVIVGATSADESQKISALLRRWPQTQVLTITFEGRTAALYELVPRKIALGEMSPSQLVDAIRASVKRRREQGTSHIH